MDVRGRARMSSRRLLIAIAAMGGGTVNNLLYGLRHGEAVFWVRDPSFLLVALGAAVVTFFAWPKYCESRAVAFCSVLSDHSPCRPGGLEISGDNCMAPAKALLGTNPTCGISETCAFENKKRGNNDKSAEPRVMLFSSNPPQNTAA